MALIALAADKGAPGVTTAAIALGAVWPRNVLVAECDPAGGDLVYRLPSQQGQRLNPATGLLSLGATARRGLRSDQIWSHTQRLVGGLEVLVGATSAEQASGMSYVWDPLGQAFAGLSEADVLADCGRLAAHSPLYGMLRHAGVLVLLTRAELDHVAHLRERVQALAAELGTSGPAPQMLVVVLSDPKRHRNAAEDVGRILASARLPASVVGSIAFDSKGANMLRGEWNGKLDKSLLIRSAREVASTILGRSGGVRG